MSKNKDQFNVTEIKGSDNISCSIQSLMLPCRDGVKLHTVIYFPLDLRKKSPVILRRSPYCQKTSIIPPDGWALDLTQGMVRARFRNSLDRAELVLTVMS